MKTTLIALLLIINSTIATSSCNEGCIDCTKYGTCDACWRKYMAIDGKSCESTSSPDTSCKLYTSVGGGGQWCAWCDMDDFANWVDQSQPCKPVPKDKVIKSCRWYAMSAGGLTCLACTDQSAPSFDLSKCSAPGHGTNCHVALRFPGSELTQCMKCIKGYVANGGICRIATAQQKGCNAISNGRCEWCDAQNNYMSLDDSGWCTLVPSSSSSASVQKESEFSGM